MSNGLNLLTRLESTDIEWLLAHGTERQTIANTILIEEGVVPENLIFVLEGLVEVRVAALPRASAVKLGPGELLGEMGFLENRPASASVIVAENSLLLEVPVTALRAALEQQPAFAARLYHAFAVTAAQRLRHREERVGKWLSEGPTRSTSASDAWPKVENLLDQFKQALQAADARAVKNQGHVDDADATAIRRDFALFVIALNDLIGDASGLHEAVREEIGSRVQRDVLPWLLLTTTAERLYAKPRGYAGDFLSIDWIYNNKAAGTGRLGALLDRCFLDEPAAQAVRNRRGLLAREITAAAAATPSRPVRVTSMACGPARELFDVIETLEDPSQLEATLIDIDREALEQVRQEVARRGLEKQFRLHHGNLVYLSMGRQKLDLPPQDLMYSIGLIDYFNDKFVTRLMDFAHSSLREGGQVVLGNFHTTNTDKALMDHILDWRLIHRSEDDMHRLSGDSAFRSPCSKLQLEEAGVNLFASSTKA